MNGAIDISRENEKFLLSPKLHT